MGEIRKQELKQTFTSRPIKVSDIKAVESLLYSDDNIIGWPGDLILSRVLCPCPRLAVPDLPWLGWDLPPHLIKSPLGNTMQKIKVGVEAQATTLFHFYRHQETPAL